MDTGKLRVGIGTWNVNGGRHIRSVALKNHSMHEWLLDSHTGKTPAEVRHVPSFLLNSFHLLSL